MKALMIIPAYEEGVKLEMTANRLRHAINRRSKPTAIEGMIMDDGSLSDQPRKIAERHQLHYLRNESRAGVGYSIRKAYDYGIESQFDILMTMAGNNKDEPEEMDRLLDPIVEDRADFVQGSRYLPGGNYGNMPAYRMISTRYLHPWIFSVVSGQKITDSTNGFRAVRASLLKDPKIILHQEWLDRYELEPYLFCMAIRLGYRVTEAPVSKVYPEKKLGYSKMRPFVDWWSILKPLFYLSLKVKK